MKPSHWIALDITAAEGPGHLDLPGDEGRGVGQVQLRLLRRLEGAGEGRGGEVRWLWERITLSAPTPLPLTLQTIFPSLSSSLLLNPN